jgi:hypothetical protein
MLIVAFVKAIFAFEVAEIVYLPIGFVGEGCAGAHLHFK